MFLHLRSSLGPASTKGGVVVISQGDPACGTFPNWEGLFPRKGEGEGEGRKGKVLDVLTEIS